MASLITVCSKIASEVSEITTLYDTILGVDSAYDAIHSIIIEQMEALNWEDDLVNDIAVNLANSWAGMDYKIDYWEVKGRLNKEMRELYRGF